MVSQTNEQALETAIERKLTGTCLEDLKTGDLKTTARDMDEVAETRAPFDTHHGYEIGYHQHFNPRFAVDEKKFWAFLKNTQEKEIEKLKSKRPGSDEWQRKILERLDRMIKTKGLLHLLKKGLSVDDAHFSLLYPAPLASSANRVKEQFQSNVFSTTRQVHYSLDTPGESIDLVLFLNGLAFATLELKNPWTGQTARFHGQKQYRTQRDKNQPLLQFGRCLVHMAVDTDEVYMTTKLAGQSTFFLPFNKGHDQGAGNPPNANGHKSAYLWEEVFSKTSIANIIEHFVRLDGKAKDPLNKRTLFFPRYHQMDVVRKLIRHSAENGVGQTCLIQHSAGSGKSNSITWAAYQLIETYPQNGQVPGAKDPERPLFDSVIVVTDRRLLDKQLRETIREFCEVKNIVAPAYRAADLKAALEQGKKVIITTIQKFPFILDGIGDLSQKNFAVIIDEAHSSQSGSAHDKMNRAMGTAADKKSDSDNEAQDDAQDKILKAMAERKMRGNASYFAFTATPKNSTLEKFGVKQADGQFKPFHLYSMKQAIEEGFILDVLANYTTYKSYYEIQKSIQENPLFNTQKAQKKLRAYVERHQQTINIKAEIILEHFIPRVVNAKKLRGKAKGMVVTQNIEAAIRYYNAVTRLLEKKGNPFKVLIAFSGHKAVDGIEYTESLMNGFSDSETRDRFDGDDCRLLVVANKYLTGFDQPKLSAMYVDKKLQHVLAVQALSRLNRSAPGLGKKTEDLFILDFFNSVEDIKAAFDRFYTATSLSRATDVNVLHELKVFLDEQGVYEWQEVQQFVTLYFNNADAQQLSPFIDVAAQRFNKGLELEDEDKADFKIKAKQFVKIYGQMASIMPFEIIEWEKLFWFLKFLIPKLIVKDPRADEIDELLNSVDLSSYGLQRVKLNHPIRLDEEETAVEPQNPNPRGVHGGEAEHDPLDDIIRNFNERWFQGWSATPLEQRVKFLSIADSIKAHPDFDDKYKNNQDAHTRILAFQKIFEDVMLKKRRDELELYKLLAADAAFKSAMQQSLRQIVDG
ncbi:type I restriction endonuclease subunit R [Desulfobacter vibrioformis]|uniref:type I restriction endonuclease subunit R n=1 Tax=Desulfobacter vibrioformis TaxID=34031 RepID=UPI00054FC2C7|nr:DEAD/DEAH box helicase family protein [Desulfobacter vibrioformis]